jgi:3-oxoadipate enol-lactonase
MWDALANQLAADCRVIAYDHRGHGSSDAPEGPYTMAGLADDAARLLRELDTGPVVWIGLSMGGMVGQELALRHPGLVAALVLAHTTSAIRKPRAASGSSASPRERTRHRSDCRRRHGALLP